MRTEANTTVRLLHLEDSPRDAELIRDRLDVEGLDCTIARAECRRSFEEALGQAPYDLILCDYNLPDYDGVTALSLARERLPHVPVIIISGSVDDEEAVKCLQLGATDYVLKQRLERFVPAVRRALRDTADREGQRLAEAELRASERLHREIVQTSPDIIILVRDGHVEYINDAGMRLLQASVATLGRLVLDWFHTDSRAAVSERLAWLAEAPRCAAMAEEKMVAANGSVVHVEMRAVSFLSTGAILTQMSCRDISKQKRDATALSQSEEQFRQIAETIEDAFWVTSHHARELVYISPGYSKIWGRNVSDLYVNPRAWTDAIVAEDRDAVFEGLRVLHDGGTLDVEFRIHRPDGTLRHIHDRGFVIRDAKGQVTRVVGVARDITHRKEAETALLERAEELERFHRLSVGRELRMVELKQEINELALQCGRAEVYPVETSMSDPDETKTNHD